ncbi:MAG: SPOR domain-containing protein [Lutimonas sp.]
MTVKFSFLVAFILMAPGLLLGQEKEGDLNVESSASIDGLVAQKKAYNKELNSYPGYKIQIYYGSEKECYEIKDEFTSLFPEIPTSIIFSTPQWKLQVGAYRTRLEADQSIQNIKKEYPSAIVLATDIELE